MLSLIIPVRDWPRERLELCIESFLGLRAPGLAEIVVVDFGSENRLRLPRRRQVRLVRVEAAQWSLAEAINAGVLSAREPIVAKTDADILVDPRSREAFEAAAEAVANGELGLALTQAIDLDQSIAPGDALPLIRGGIDGHARLRPKWGQGGLVFFSRRVWDQVGGFEARFTGWGNEDNDFAERVRRAGHRIGWTDREALRIYHVWHPPSYAATGVLKQRLKNQKIARDDRSVFRSPRFVNSNFAELARPAVMNAVSPLVTLALATTARPNRDRMIGEAIESFRGQIDNDLEIVVMDNGSPPAATQRLKRRLERIKWAKALRVEALADASIPAARNAISAMARGRYICVVDDDDIALPNRLADHLQVFARDGLAHGSHGGWIDFDESTGVIERNSGKQRTVATLLKGTGKITAHPASLFRADVMRAVPYDEAFALGSDFDLALRMASLGLEIRHTGTYLTLRRFHSANVTITGQSNQVSNGLAARSRTTASFAWSRQKGIEDAARTLDAEVYCRNPMSIDSLADLIPGYSGRWRIYAPVAALARPALAANDDGTPLALPGDLLPGASRPAGVDEPDAEMDGSLLDALLEITAGEVCTKRSGLNQPIFFRSTEIAGLKKARRMRDAIEALLKVPVQINSVTQAELDREAPFNWKAIEIKPGERVLQSERFADLSDLLVCFGRIEPASLLRQSLSILADFDDDGEAYYLVTRPVRGYDELRALKFELEQSTATRFRHVAANGLPSELTLSARSH